MDIENVHTKYTRKRIDMKLPELLLEKVDSLCRQKVIDRTYYIETLIRKDLMKRNIRIEPLGDYGTFEDWGWEEKPKLRVANG